jgi:hypothetical protein
LVAAHLLDYFVVVRSGIHRTEVLEATGHRYLPGATVAALGVAFVAVLAATALGFVRGRGGDESRLGIGGVALRLSVVQVLGFVGLEIVERLVAGASLVHLTGSLLAVGIGLQVAVACAGAILLRLIGRVAEAVGRSFRIRPGGRPAPRAVSLPRGERVPRLLFTHSRSVRAPPAPLLQPV